MLRWLRAIKFYYHVKANLLVDRHVKLEPMNGFLPMLLGLELGLGLELRLGIGLGIEIGLGLGLGLGLELELELVLY